MITDKSMTIVDLLKKGNLELFHSSMIAWLLDPEREHGLKRSFPEKFASLLKEKGFPKLYDSVRNDSKSVKVLTEVTERKQRYDIQIIVGDCDYSVFIENKVKSVGRQQQIDSYQKAQGKLVLLGLSELNFPDGIQESEDIYFISYKEILEVLQKLNLDSSNDYRILIKHYMKFLFRETNLIELLERCYDKGDFANCHSQISEQLSNENLYKENDHRFLNLLLLEMCKRRLSNGLINKHLIDKSDEPNQLELDKNVRSGVCLYIFPEMAAFSSPLQKLADKYKAKFWFHIELKDGIIAESHDDIAGCFQLRCKAGKKANNEALRRSFYEEYISYGNELKLNESKIRSNWSTFYVLQQSLDKSELVLENFENKFISFCNRFGDFS